MRRARGNDTTAAYYLLAALHGPDVEPTEEAMVGGILLARGLRNLERLTAIAGGLAGLKSPKE